MTSTNNQSESFKVLPQFWYSDLTQRHVLGWQGSFDNMFINKSTLFPKTLRFTVFKKKYNRTNRSLLISKSLHGLHYRLLHNKLQH
jgi:hypothetical protein